MSAATNSRIPGLYNLPAEERVGRVAESSGVPLETMAALRPESSVLSPLADAMVENAVGFFAVPLGVAANFRINGVDRLVPMATEESSVIAAASHAAMIAREAGGFAAGVDGALMIAQVQVLDVADPYGARLRLLEARDELLALAARQDPVLVELGHGPREVEVRIVGEDPVHVVLHLIVDVGDAMGANAVNTMAEAIAPRIAELAAGRSLLRILSNKADRRLAWARAVFPAARLGGPEVVEAIVAAYRFAAADPYRAATHNKGIMNGISAVVLATGNDTRAVEAGAHSHAARDGRYTSLSDFEVDADGNLVGTLQLPMPVGLVGGATKVHPTAGAALRLLGVSRAAELAEVIVAVGLAQNLAALKALSTEGIQRGHMSLHARNVALAAGATDGEVAAVADQLVASGQINQAAAETALASLRAR